MSPDILWPSKPLPLEQVRPYLPADFDQMSPEQQDAAYLLADWRAKNPGKDLDDLERELRADGIFLVVLSALLVAAVVGALVMVR